MATSNPATMKQDAGLHFVVSTDLAKPHPELRKLIRSHVMVGKNRGRRLPPRKTKRTNGQYPSTSSSSSSASGSPSTSLSISPTVSDALVRVHTPSPRKFGSECSTVRFADNVEPGTVEVVLQCKLPHTACFNQLIRALRYTYVPQEDIGRLTWHVSSTMPCFAT